MKKITRRQMLRITAGASVIVPLGLLTTRLTHAADLPQLDPNDPMAKALEYVLASANPDQHCKSCQLYSGEVGAEWGPCAVFPGKSVNANGWCKSWLKKSG
jgi:High potential iron-sulfur protein